MTAMLIVTASSQISIPRCILLASNFLSNDPNAEIYVTSASRLKDIKRQQRLTPAEKLTASQFALWSDECSTRACSCSAPVFVVLDPFDESGGATGPHKELFASLKSIQSVYLVAPAIDLFKKNARGGDQVLICSFSLRCSC